MKNWRDLYQCLCTFSIKHVQVKEHQYDCYYDDEDDDYLLSIFLAAQIDPEKIIEYPGFTVLPPEGVKDVSVYLYHDRNENTLIQNLSPPSNVDTHTE